MKLWVDSGSGSRPNAKAVYPPCPDAQASRRFGKGPNHSFTRAVDKPSECRACQPRRLVPKNGAGAASWSSRSCPAGAGACSRIMTRAETAPLAHRSSWERVKPEVGTGVVGMALLLADFG